MRYRTRHAERKVTTMARYFPAVLVTGARQVGKSTLLTELFPEARALVFDATEDLYGARRDPDLFLDKFPAPLILDEIQYAPELLSALKRRVDRTDRRGSYLLTGSQNLGVLRSVAESMAGRVGVLQLHGMTGHEMAEAGASSGWLGDYLDAPGELLERRTESRLPLERLARFLWRGSMPGVLYLPDELVPDYYRSYLSTYVERDIRRQGEIRALTEFGRFLGLSGALTAQEINDSQLGRELGLSPKTARRWRDLLVHSYQWVELFPYHGNTLKRVSGRRKGYLLDTGLACYLQRISSPEALAVSPLLGALFESWVVADLLRHLVGLGVPPQAWHWRTNGGAEVDLVLERDGKLYPIVVKAKSRPTGHDTRGIRAFHETYGPAKVMPGLVVHAGRERYRLNDLALAIPWNMA